MGSLPITGLDSECVFLQITLDCKKKTLINISKPQGKTTNYENGMYKERHTDGTEREEGGRMQCLKKKKDSSLLDVENVETTGERCCHLS